MVGANRPFANIWWGEIASVGRNVRRRNRSGAKRHTFQLTSRNEMELTTCVYPSLSFDWKSTLGLVRVDGRGRLFISHALHY